MENKNMMNESLETQPTTQKKEFHRLLLIVVVLIALVEFVLLVKNNKKAPPSSVSTTANKDIKIAGGLNAEVEGTFNVATSNNQTNYNVGSPITITLNADSNGRGVVGFDAVLRYDQTKFTLGSLKSSVDGFSAVSNNSKGYLEITSSKDPQTTVTPVFKNTPVITLTLIPLKAGTYKIELMDILDNSSTKFLDVNTKVFLPETNGIEVMVK